MDERDLALRNRIYASFVETGRAATLEELGGDEAALRRLHDQHALVLEPDRAEIRMLPPFSAVPTPYEVEAGGRRWHANCVWDAFGIPAALGTHGRVEGACPDCGARLEVAVTGGKPDRADLVAHFLVPARAWWDDIVFT